MIEHSNIASFITKAYLQLQLRNLAIFVHHRPVKGHHHQLGEMDLRSPLLHLVVKLMKLEYLLQQHALVF